MNIQDIAALVAIRNYAVAVREDRHVFKGNQYQAVTAKVQRIDSFLARVITEVDLVNLVQNSPQNTKSKATKKPTSIKRAGSDASKRAPKVSDSQISLAFEEKDSNKKETFDDDEDADLIAKTIAKEKAKLQARKTK